MYRILHPHTALVKTTTRWDKKYLSFGDNCSVVDSPGWVGGWGGTWDFRGWVWVWGHNRAGGGRGWWGAIQYRRSFRNSSLQRYHNERDGISNHNRLDCLLNCLFRRISRKSRKLRVTGLCEGNSHSIIAPWSDINVKTLHRQLHGSKHPRSWLFDILRDLTIRATLPLGNGTLGLYSLSARTSYCKVSWSLEAAILDVILIVSLSNSPGISAALLSRCLWNFRTIEKVKTAASSLNEILR